MMESCPTMLQERTLENFLLGTSYTARNQQIVFFFWEQLKWDQGVINSVHML